MILHCNFEELRALSAGAEVVLGAAVGSSDSPVAAPAEAMAQVEMLVPRLTGDLSVSTLAEQRMVRGAVALICESLHTRMDERILAYHPGHEEAVTLYFDYAHTRTVLDRVDRMGAEMGAIIELITGETATEETARGVTFSD
ncbi:MAG: hypothetical protein M3P24_03155 [Gemmatimonadota bacterium]|nr:hypothetical protein [Gemmatimonadota bacterium]